MIPLWLVKGLAWAFLAVLLAGVVLLIMLALVWIQERLFKAARLVLMFHGSWAAYINYVRVRSAAAGGGVEWFNSLLVPGETQDLDGPSADPVPYFWIAPRPDLWRWWMALLGAKRPKLEA